MLNIIEEKLLECHVHFPSFGERSSNDLALLTKIFERHLSEYSDNQLSAAFDEHMDKNDRFPTVADIKKYFATVTAYRMDWGPEGFGTTYAADHPYVRKQVQKGYQIGQYAVEIPVKEHACLKVAAANCVLPDDDGDDETPKIERRGSGLRRLSYDW